MRRHLPVVALVVAAALAAGAARILLREAPAPGPPEPAGAPPPGPPARRAPAPSGPEFPPPDSLPPDPDPAPAPVPPEEAPLPPDAYPWEVPGWWDEVDRRLREKEVLMEDTLRPVKEILAHIEKEVLFPVRAGPELETWAAEFRLSMPVTRAPARAILEAIALRSNLEIVLNADAVLLRQRGRAKEDRVTRAGRVQAALRESEERRAGVRGPDPGAEGFASSPVDIALDGVPLREASRLLGEKLAVPVYMDAGLWAANPPVKVEPGERSLSSLLDAVAGPLGAAWDVTPRRVVLFRPRR